jgi:Tol biopolymer transport system component
VTGARRIVVVAAVLVVFAFVAGCGGGDGAETEPSGGEIAFTVHDGGWNEIWLMAADGSERQRLTEAEPPGNDAAGSGSPAWSPDGTQIAFAAQTGTLEEDQRMTEIYVMRADGTDRRRLTTNEALDASPSWSPDGERIAFTRITEPGSGTARSGIFVVDAGGGNELQLTHAALPSVDAGPAWSPDGSEIAFTRAAPSAGSDDPRAGIYAVSPEGGEPRKLADDGAEPDWSPDGTRIAFTSYRDGFGRTCFQECSTSGEIYVLDVDSGEARRLTESKANEGSPAWSPDGDFIAFVSDRSNPEAHANEIYVMTASGDGVRRVTENTVWDTEPAWRPSR